MKKELRKIDYGLRELPTDARDFSHTRTFGSINIDDLPAHDFLVAAPLEIKNQDINYPSDYCAAYSASELAEYEDQVVFCPEWTFAYAKHLLWIKYGSSVLDSYGLNLRDVANAALSKNGGGFLPRSSDPFKCDTTDRPLRSILVNLANWPPQLLPVAQKYAKEAYYAVDGPHDLFDNFRAVMWKNLAERRGIITGCYWRHSWGDAPNGIIPKTYEETGLAHAFVFCGQKTIEEEIYLVARLTDGINFGDNGFFYFPREVVNREFTLFGAYTFKDKLPTDVSGQNGVLFNYPVNKFSPLYPFRVISNLIKKFL